MTVTKTDTFFISLTKENFFNFFKDLNASRTIFEVLNPKTLGEKWTSVSLNGSKTLEENKSNLEILNTVLKTRSKKGFFASLIDTRFVVKNEEIAVVKLEKDFIIGLAQTIIQWNKLKQKKSDILNFVSNNTSSHALFGGDLTSFKKDFTDFVQKLSVEVDPNLALPVLDLKEVAGYQVLLFDGKDSDMISEFLVGKKYSQIVTGEELLESIENRLHKIQDLLQQQDINPASLSQEQYKKFAVLHASLELEQIALDSTQNVFSLDEKSSARFAFVTIRKNEVDKMLLLLDKHKLAYENVEWTEDLVDWDNAGGLRSFQDVAQALGTIDEKETDPTSVVSIFFMVFFAFCLNDAFYGIVLSLFTGYFLYFKNLKQQFKSIFNLFFFSGLVTIVLGILTNSWAGDFFNSNIVKSFTGTTITETLSDSSTPINDFLSNFQLIDILNSESSAPINSSFPDSSPIIIMLLVAVFLGFLSILSAYFLKISANLKSGETASAVASFAWIFFIFSIIVATVLNANNLSQQALGVVLVGLACILVFNEAKSIGGKLLGALFGSQGLYGLIQFGADLMSFTRIIAIGLTGGVIAQIINILAAMVYDAGGPVIGILLGFTLLLVGHIFNFVLALFGAYINPIRLTYVEFMPKFFEGRGRQINPTYSDLSYLKIV